MSRAWFVALATVAAALVLQTNAFAADASAIAGVVRDQNGRPVEGAIITITNRELQRGTSVFAGKDGNFRMPALELGHYDLRVRRVGYQDLSQSGISLENQSAVTLTMIRETDPNELAWQLPANRWTPLLLEHLSSDARREEFVRQCA